MKKEPVHTRTITMEAYDIGDNRLLVEGRLVDIRHREGVQHLGLPLPAGLLHDMRLSLTVNMRTMEIEAAEAAMPKGAEPGCPAITPNYRRVIGLRVGPGFKKAVAERVGGPAGCVHMTTLLQEMGSTVIQATAAFPPSHPDKFVERLVAASEGGKNLAAANVAYNSCHMWAEDGPLTQEVRELLAGQRQWGVPGKTAQEA